MNKKIAIVGAGGHGKVVGEIALLNNYKTIDFFDDYILSSDNKFPFPILGNCKDLKNNLQYYDDCFIAIGENKIRYEIMTKLIRLKAHFVNLIHPTSTISQYSNLDKGICVMANAAINPGTTIGEGVIINTSTSVDHDCFVEDYAKISPGCTLSGNVRVGKLTHIGTGSSVHPGIVIGSNVKIGVGSSIFKNIENNKVFKN
ncbi:acetyltransferase [Candidatus Pelagibacter sp.]|nr:acetyltransferase [Candidatus Pelagibacter sp.]